VIRVGAVLGIVAACVIAGTASAATIKVETKKDEAGAGGTPKCALREAVQAANDNAKFGGCSKGQGADKIVLGRGAYKLSIDNNLLATEDANADGDIDVSSRVTITGKGAAKTAVDGNAQNLNERILHLVENNLTVVGVTLRNAREIDGDGGAARNSGDGKMTVRSSRVLGNYTSSRGGGLAHTSGAGDLVVENTVVANNASGSYGGGISGYNGAAGADLTIRNSKILDNIGGDTGGIMTPDGRFRLINSVVAGNAGFDYGGGMNIYGAIRTLIKNSTIANNRVTYEDYGGGIYAEGPGGPVRIEGSTIANNYSAGDGGGIYAYGSDPWTIRNTTISGNQAMNDEGEEGQCGCV
jgi:hypothetical protein